MADNVKRHTVLVVDDTPDNLTLMADILKGDYAVKVARSGERALQIAAGSDRPDLILLDVMMPEMDGYEVIRRLRESETLRAIPVIFVTAMHDAEDEEKGFALGAVDYLTKPINPAIALARVKTHLALNDQTRRLRELSTKLSRYLSPQIYQAIFEGVQETRIRAQRKKLTIFFSDIKDFTQTTEDLEPEDLTYLLNKYFSEMSKIAIEYGATIDKFVGDAMLMFFGDPETRGVKEDALQCLRMAVAMQRRMTDLQGVWRDKGYQRPFEMRIGINTGFCNVGNFGSDVRMDYTIIGSGVNLAARLEQAADPGGILMSYETYVLISDEVNVTERAPVTAKGFAKEIRTFAVEGIQDNVDATRRFIQTQRPGLRLTLDLDRMVNDERELVVHDLEQAIQRIRSVT